MLLKKEMKFKSKQSLLITLSISVMSGCLADPENHDNPE